MSRAIFHIGTEKTGTTALQTYFATKRDALTQHGFRYSSAAGKRNHLKLYLYASQGKGAAKNMIGRLKGNTDAEAFEREFVTDFEKEVSEHRDKVFVLSNEHCRGRLNRDQIARLHGFLSRFFDEIDIIVYIRRQDELAVSRYSTMIKAGMTHELTFGDAGELDYFFDYSKFLTRWGSVFGADRIKVRRFEKGALEGDSVITDFCRITGIPELAHKDRRANQSLLPSHQEFLRQMNMRLLHQGHDAEATVRLRLLRMVLIKLGSGRGQMPSRAEAEAFYRSYAQSNEKVRKRFFPERTTLFDEDFSAYPVEPAGSALDLDTALDIAAALWNIASQGRQLPREMLQSEESGSDPALTEKPAKAGKRHDKPPAHKQRGMRNRDGDRVGPLAERPRI